jgi:queuine tRNA-ribosyltransferase
VSDFSFQIEAEDGVARAGVLHTPHGDIETPAFMPVGTHGAVKGVSPAEVASLGTDIILGNTYHLYLRPGDEVIRDVGGIHKFTGWNGPMLTDSGGFQVFSLGERGMQGNEKAPLRRVSEEGITFQSHLDGSKHLFTPEKSIEVQQNLGADIIMAFDQPVYGLSSEEAAREALDRTHRWLERSVTQWQKGDTSKQALFGIVQGGIYTDLHTESAAFVSSLDLPGNAIGGLSVGESKEAMWEATASIASKLPEHKPRYFMGLGEPIDVIEAALRGVDMYDCVAPSRIARHGAVWQITGTEELQKAFWEGGTEALLAGKLKSERWNMTTAAFATDAEPLVPVKTRLPEDLQVFTRATIHHYLKEKEMLGYRILTLHNIAVLQVMTEHIRKAIKLGKLQDFRNMFIS